MKCTSSLERVLVVKDWHVSKAKGDLSRAMLYKHRVHLIIVIIIIITTKYSRFRSMTTRIIIWTLKLLDTEHRTAKVLQAGV